MRPARVVALGLAAVGVAALLGAAAWLLAGVARPEVVGIEPGEPVTSLDQRRGMVLELQPGDHDSFAIDTPGVTVRGRPGAVVAGDIQIRADGVRLERLDVRGGLNGVTVREVDGVVLDHVRVVGAELHGIEVIDASATITRCDVRGLTSAYAQGIEVRNATGRPRTVVRGCTVTGGQEGIVASSARAEFLDNEVWATTMRAITVGEMSEALVQGNRIAGVAGAGVMCVDMSHCEIRANHIHDVAAVPGGPRSQGGHGVVAFYYASMREHGNEMGRLDGEAVVALVGSIEVDRFPLSIWPPGLRGALPALWVAALALGVIGAARWAAGALLARRPLRAAPTRYRPRARLAPGLRRAVLGVVVAGIGVQAFHMLEHVVQVWQTYVAHAEVRSGILGRSIDTEWVHFVFNTAVLGFVVLLWRTAVLLGRLDHRVHAWLLATVVVQGYHVIEHVVKLGQHLGDGLRVAPGIVGGQVGLVWFHFGINLAVFAGMLMVAAGIVRARRRRPEPGPARQVPLDRSLAAA